MAWSDSDPAPTAPYQLLDDGQPVELCDLAVIGCGNILRGDDAAGPVLIRQMYADGAPDGVRLVDGGTAGMDVAFAMRGADRVVIVDAAATGAEPGTLFRVPAEELADLPPIDGLHSHNFRWDHAISFSDWLLGPLRPSDITVFLIEVESCEPGAVLTDRVAEGVNRVQEMIRAEFFPTARDSAGIPVQAASREWTVEMTDQGHLHLPAELAALHFGADVLLAQPDGAGLALMPLASASNGGLVLKQRNAAGDRSVLIHEVLAFQVSPGRHPAIWDAERGVLLVDLSNQFNQLEEQKVRR